MVYEVLGSEKLYQGEIVAVRRDTVRMPGGSHADREVVEHVDSVAVVALNSAGELLLLRQYRHPAAEYLWELPAGLRDQNLEQAEEAARRELAEETGWHAERWHTLVDLRPSPGMSTEVVRVYLARQLTHHPRAGEAEGEETDLKTRWVDLPTAVREVLDGRITNGLAVAGVLAADAVVGLREDRIRAADVSWPDAT